jgi:hypothetical protein
LRLAILKRLGLVEKAADRAAVLRELFEIETALQQVSTRRITELAAEIRQTEATIAKLVGQLVPDPSAAQPPNSRQHQRAAMARWIPQRPNADLREALLAEAREMFGNVIGFDSYIDDLARASRCGCAVGSCRSIATSGPSAVCRTI